LIHFNFYWSNTTGHLKIKQWRSVCVWGGGGSEDKKPWSRPWCTPTHLCTYQRTVVML